jgi:hypothetical protein
MDATALETLLRRTNPKLIAARAALASGRWERYLREQVPPPSRLAVLRRRAWRAAYCRALELGATTEMRAAVVFPIWYGNNEDEVARDDWEPAVVVSYDDGSCDLCEGRSLPGAIVVAQLEQTRFGYLMPSIHYAPDVNLRYRNRHYAADVSLSIERVIEVQRTMAVPAVARPAREVAAFHIEAEPAVALAEIEPALAERVRRATDRLRIAPDAA